MKKNLHVIDTLTKVYVRDRKYQKFLKAFCKSINVLKRKKALMKIK